MTVFLYVVAGVVWFAVLVALIGAGFLASTELYPDGDYSLATKILAPVVWLLAVVLLICIPIWGGVFDENNAEHCGPGTFYRESTQYNVATKSSETEWWCEAR
jgi:hypothetical protein